MINNTWYLVDLPGYGYARVSKTDRKKWQAMIKHYLIKRDTLRCTFVLIDSRIPPQAIDIDFINGLGELFIPFVIVYTKTEKLKAAELETNLNNFRTALLEHWNELPQQFITSSIKKTGGEEILSFIGTLNN